MAKLSIHLLGPLEIRLDDEIVTGFESNKVRALLAYLAAESKRAQPRDRLAGSALARLAAKIGVK